MKARSAKAKGTKLEKEVCGWLQDVGEIRRQPGSGIYADFPHDNEFRFCGHRFILECKARKEGHRTLDRWRGMADVLVIKPDRQEPSVYMPISTFREFLSIAVAWQEDHAQGTEAKGDG